MGTEYGDRAVGCTLFPLHTHPAIRRLILSTCLFALVHAIASEAFSQNTDVKAELQQRFQDKIFFIRGWYQDKELIYDATGTVIGTPTRGSWTGSLVKIRSIKVGPDDFVLKGPRGGDVYDQKNKKFVAVIAKKPEVTIIVETDPAKLTSADLDNLQNAIFAQNAKTDEMPEYWREFLLRGDQDTKTEQAGAPGKSETLPGLQSNSQPLSQLVQGVSPPRILKQNEPAFSEVARGARYQGTVVVRMVVDDQGIPTKIRLTKVLGMGLDDAAVNCVEQWRFVPAKRDDKPVAVTVDIEVNFRLY